MGHDYDNNRVVMMPIGTDRASASVLSMPGALLILASNSRLRVQNKADKLKLPLVWAS